MQVMDSSVLNTAAVVVRIDWQLKCKSVWCRCGKYRHWKEERNYHKLLKLEVTSNNNVQMENTPAGTGEEFHEESESQNHKPVLSFKSTVAFSALVANASSTVSEASRNVKPLFNYAAPYNAINEMVLHFLSKDLLR